MDCGRRTGSRIDINRVVIVSSKLAIFNLNYAAIKSTKSNLVFSNKLAAVDGDAIAIVKRDSVL